MKKGLIVLAHGSKVAETDEIMTQYVETISKKVSFEHVEKAYLQMMSPDLGAAVANLNQAGIQDVLVFPFFLFNGNHIQEDIPNELEALKIQYPEMSFTFMDNIGYETKLAEIVADRIERM